MFEIGSKFYGKNFHDRVDSLLVKLGMYDSGCWVAEIQKDEQNPEEREVIAYMISYPYDMEHMPLDPEFKKSLTQEQLEAPIYLVHDVVVREDYRFLGVHKHFHKIAVIEAKSHNME